MMNTTLTTEQKEVVKNWKDLFVAFPCDEGIRYICREGLSAETYCTFLRLDNSTLRRLGDITYSIVYDYVESKYVLRCETYINGCMHERLSTEFEETEDYLGFYGECMGSKQKDLLDMSAEELKKYLKENYDDYSDLEDLFKAEVNEEEIAEDYIKDNPSHAFDTALDFMSDYDTRDAIKDAIDRL